MTIGERIKQVRTLNKLSQEAFAKKIGIKGSAISLYESNERTVTEASIKSICREFQINEDWLRTGKGKPEKRGSIYNPQHLPMAAPSADTLARCIAQFEAQGITAVVGG